MSREISQFIADRYRLDLKIGTGGMGTVFKGYDLHLKRAVALKLIRADSLSSQLITRLHREAKAICKIEHDNIVKVFDFLMYQENEAVMVMELVSGRSLDQTVKADGPYPILPALDIFRQICEAMSFAHKQGVLHRDLKPSNVLLSETRGAFPIVKVVDFGVAQVSSMQDQTLTQPGFLVGSPGYVSPEQARGREVDVRSDVYSLGCLMFFVLTGKPP
ncbi:MAG: serine/threonine protein kinase, partial [Cyanobacteria bacterium]|nr:serine/threonine protein kinase [Cyanobacteriota bacterium]